MRTDKLQYTIRMLTDAGIGTRFTVQAVEEQMNMVNPLQHVVTWLACPTCCERGLVGVAAADAPGLPMQRTALPRDR